MQCAYMCIQYRIEIPNNAPVSHSQIAANVDSTTVSADEIEK